MNYNVNNNEQEIMLKEKIKKREKIDTILAYALMVILLGCIGGVLALKFLGNNDEELPPIDELTPNYISLEQIASSLNSSVLANRYVNDGATFTASVNGNALIVNYVNGEVTVSGNIPVIGNELMFNISAENSDIGTEIYKEIASIVCMYYGNEEKYCRYTLNNIEDNGTDGIRINKNGDTTIIYIDITKSYTTVNEIVYNDVVVSDIHNTDYVLEMSDVRVSDINIVNSDTDVVFRGNVERVSDEIFNFDVAIKLYDLNGNLLGENKYEYNNENILEGTGVFEVRFLLSDTLKMENINKYSVEIVK